MEKSSIRFDNIKEEELAKFMAEHTVAEISQLILTMSSLLAADEEIKREDKKEILYQTRQAEKWRNKYYSLIAKLALKDDCDFSEDDE